MGTHKDRMIQKLRVSAVREVCQSIVDRESLFIDRESRVTDRYCLAMAVLGVLDGVIDDQLAGV